MRVRVDNDVAIMDPISGSPVVYIEVGGERGAAVTAILQEQAALLFDGDQVAPRSDTRSLQGFQRRELRRELVVHLRARALAAGLP